MVFRNLGLGLGLRAPHFSIATAGKANVSWFEVVTENFLGIAGGTGGPPLEKLRKVRENYQIVLHGVSLNIGSTDALNLEYLKNLKALDRQIEPAWVSDHFCWTGVNNHNLHDLLPLPYNRGTIDHLCERIQFCQDYLGRRMVFENVSSYLTYSHSEMTEWQFISEIAHRAGCGLLVDVNNIFVSSHNHKFDPLDFLRGLPRESVAQIHLAGHSIEGEILIDTHDQPVAPEVWGLYAHAVKLFGPLSTMVEWDANIPSYQELEAEIFKARHYWPEIKKSERAPTGYIGDINA